MTKKTRKADSAATYPTNRRSFITGAGAGVAAASLAHSRKFESVFAASQTQGVSRTGQFNVLDSGAVGNGSADDTAAIQKAINLAAQAGGGTVLFPAGYTFACASGLNLDYKAAIHLVGTGGAPGGGNKVALLYRGADPAAFISLKSASGVELRNLHIQATNSAFSGALISADNVKGADASLLLFDYCNFNAPLSAKALIRLNNTISSRITNCRFDGGRIGVLGRDGGYSNVIMIDNNFFMRQAVASIKNAGESWLIQGCTFEPLANGAPGGYTHDNYQALELSFISNWFGDCSKPGVAIQARAVGLFIAGNFMYFSSAAAAGSTAIKLYGSEGVSITGNYFFGNITALDFSDYIYGASVQGNSLNTRVPIVNPEKALASIIAGNHRGGVPYQNSLGGNTGIGTTAPAVKLHVVGDVMVTGNLSKGSGTFLIDHPLDPENKNLYHGFVEAPRHDLIYRGKAQLAGGKSIVSIDAASGMTKGTFAALTQNPQIFLQNETGWEPVKATINGGTLTINCKSSNSTDTIEWMVVAERADAFIRTTAHVDAQGRMIPEVDKPAPSAEELRELETPVESLDANESAASAVKPQEIVQSLVGKKGYPLHGAVTGGRVPVRKRLRNLKVKNKKVL